MKKKRNIILSVIMTIIAVVYTYLVKTVDVKKIGPNDSMVGFSKLNGWFRDIIGSNMTLYKITEILGYLVILIAVFYAFIGLLQLIKRKNIFKVDREIYILGGFYVMMGIVYVFFEKFIINYRPIIIDGELEASYPSSHTMLAICIGISSLIVSKKYIPEKYLKITNIVTILLLLGVLLGRVVSGVHWISDILGGIIISLTLLMYFITLYNYKSKTKRRRH